ncbi:RAMP superfamily CRISPR-associated protein [Micromonospora sp. WMMD998]|uniref:RAMP superfamily CRISPR-associated protein n=1 Tax=Micromonospora sp. WMMD998 TaxID=3016092 RepID=UPI002499B98A|nr:RAMP superfamily CRISPR-associated protein [Micromonospora sp. WMMD998]WFE38078.1 RAMP superfamily CRISPR-associated protein [Micromonospora sp. WMMD998]
MTLTFEITFHGPFRVATGRAGDGTDSVIDRDVPLPASSIKGVMRSAARDLLTLPPHLVEAVFGTAWQPSPWSWSDATLTGDRRAGNADPGDEGGDGVEQLRVRTRARIQISEATHTVVDGALAVGEEILARRAVFTVRRNGPITAADLPRHEAVLTAAARAVTALGGDRRRGLGWVSITPLHPAWTAASADHLTDLLHSSEEPS